MISNMLKLVYYASYSCKLLLQGVTNALENAVLTRIFVCKCYKEVALCVYHSLLLRLAS